MSHLIARLLIIAFFFSAAHAQEKTWSRLNNCRLMENPANDGDSFHVQYQGKEFIFRLYFVDTCETNELVPTRVQEQAKFLRIPLSRVIPAGLAAEEMTKKYLTGQIFTVVTRWEDAMGASRLPRNYAFILFGKNDESDLASSLVQNGLARIYGMSADPPGPLSAAQFQSNLYQLEAAARHRRAGIWGDLASATSAAGSGVTASAVGNTPASSTTSSATIILPANSHPPDVVDNPGDDVIADYAIQVTEATMVIQTGLPEGNFSEIPGWKPQSKSAPESESEPTNN